MTQSPETLLCDTSYVIHTERATKRPDLVAHWPRDILNRIDRAQLVISVMTVAEIRFGQMYADWKPKRSAASDNRLRAFGRIPLDPTILEEWAQITSECTRTGWTVGDNDRWIAATAMTRGFPLVSCDKTQCGIPRVVAIYLPIDDPAGPPTSA